MWAISLIYSFLILHLVASSDVKLPLDTLSGELQCEILLSNSVDFCKYVLCVDKGVITPASPDVENTMLIKAAKEERNLKLKDDTQRVRKQQILRSVRALVRIYSQLPIVCNTTDKEELEQLAERFESTYRFFSSFSVSPTWKKACMAGLFRCNTLSPLLPHLSDDFRQNTWAILLQTAFFVGDIDSLEAVTESFRISKENVSNMVSKLDVVFSNNGTFFKELFELLPSVMEKKLGLIREASSLQHLDILLGILEVAKPVEPHKLDQIIDSFCRLEMCNNKLCKDESCKDEGCKPAWFKDAYIKDKLGYVLYMAALHGHLPIIRFLWPAMEAKWKVSEYVFGDLMIGASRNNHRSVLEFLLFESGTLYMQMAQKFVNSAFEAALSGG